MSGGDFYAHIIKKMTKILKVHTFDNKSILFRYTPGTKNIDDITNAMIHEIGYRCSGVDKYSYRCENERTMFTTFEMNNSTKTPEELLDMIDEIRLVQYRKPMILKQQQLQSPIRITLKTLSNHAIPPIETTTCMSVELLKEKIEDKLGFCVENQNLIFGGKRLQNENTLESYGVIDGSEIYLTLSLRGGMYHEISGRNGIYKPLAEITIYDFDTKTLII